MGRAEIWGCSLHLSPDGTAWTAESAKTTCCPELFQADEESRCWEVASWVGETTLLYAPQLVLSIRLEAPNRQTPALAPLVPSPGPARHPTPPLSDPLFDPAQSPAPTNKYLKKKFFF